MGGLLLAGALAGGLTACGGDSGGGQGDGAGGGGAANGQPASVAATVIQGATLDQITADQGLGAVLGDLEEGETVQVFCHESNHYAILMPGTETGIEYWTNAGDVPLGHVYRTDLDPSGDVPLCSLDGDGNIHGDNTHADH